MNTHSVPADNTTRPSGFFMRCQPDIIVWFGPYHDAVVLDAVAASYHMRLAADHLTEAAHIHQTTQGDTLWMN